MWASNWRTVTASRPSPRNPGRNLVTRSSSASSPSSERRSAAGSVATTFVSDARSKSVSRSMGRRGPPSTCAAPATTAGCPGALATKTAPGISPPARTAWTRTSVTSPLAPAAGSLTMTPAAAAGRGCAQAGSRRRPRDRSFGPPGCRGRRASQSSRPGAVGAGWSFGPAGGEQRRAYLGRGQRRHRSGRALERRPQRPDREHPANPGDRQVAGRQLVGPGGR